MDTSLNTPNPVTAPLPTSRVRRFALPSLGLHLSERRLLLGVVDSLLLCIALLISILTFTDIIRAPGDLIALYKWPLTLILVWLVCAFLFDCYDLARAASTVASVRNAASAVLVTILVYTLIPIVTPPLTSRGLVFYFGALAVVLVSVWRLAYARLFIQPWFHQRALVVGAGNAGRLLVTALRAAPNDANPFRGTGYTVVGFIDDDHAHCGDCVEGLPVLGGRESLLAAVEAQRVDKVILAITHRDAIHEDLFDALFLCRERGLRVVTMATVYERLTGRVPIYHVGRDLHMVVPMDENAGERAYHFLKRLVDLATAGVGLVVMLPVALIIALVNAATSPGPLFYHQRRVGQGGVVFEMLKFRSMRVDAERQSGAVWACTDDNRITPAGHWLRRTRLDELPQSWNILCGNMSLVGPRPERPEFVEDLARAIPFYRARHAVKPGLTGWAQIRFHYGNSTDDARIKLEYDLFYVKHAGTFLDLQIMLQTLPVMLLGRGM